MCKKKSIFGNFRTAKVITNLVSLVAIFWQPPANFYFRKFAQIWRTRVGAQCPKVRKKCNLGEVALFATKAKIKFFLKKTVDFSQCIAEVIVQLLEIFARHGGLVKGESYIQYFYFARSCRQFWISFLYIRTFIYGFDISY